LKSGNPGRQCSQLGEAYVDRVAGELHKEAAEAAEGVEFSDVAWRLLELAIHDVADHLRPEAGRQQWFDTWISQLLSSMGESAAAKSIRILCTDERIAELAGADDGADDEAGDRDAVEEQAAKQGKVAPEPKDPEKGTSL
jgi:hypothetical protein